MPLYEPGRPVGADPRDQVATVHRFLHQCRDWATEREIPKRADRVRAGAGAEEAAKLHAWVAYRDFLDHALRELEAGQLDAWFPPPPDPR